MSIASRAASLAKISASQVQASDLPVRGLDSGSKCFAWFATFDHATSSWRTSQLCFTGDLEPFSATWPRSGLMRNGTCSRCVPLVLHTHASACFLLPTPTKSDAGLGEIESPTRPDAITGKPRKVNAIGLTWSTGLGRLSKIATGLALSPRLPEWLMGFPRNWTSDGLPSAACSETQSPPSSRSSSATE